MSSKRSDAIIKGPARAPARAMLRAAGLTDESFDGPLIAVFNTWTNMGPCNMDLDKLAVPVRAGIRAAGGTPIDFNSIAVSDGITMGSEGMRASLMSREVIADSIELAVKGHSLDGVIILVACDKTIPAAAMALARMNVPGVVVYGGSIMPGHHKGQDLLDLAQLESFQKMNLPKLKKPPAPVPALAGDNSPLTLWQWP